MQSLLKMNYQIKLKKYYFMKYENVLYYYIHFYIISSFEIVFYVYYVSQLESEKFNEFLESLLNNYLNNINTQTIQPYLNQTNYINDIGNCKNTDYLAQLDNYNTELLSKPIYFVYGTSTLFIALFAYDVCIMTCIDSDECRERCDSGSETNPMVTEKFDQSNSLQITHANQTVTKSTYYKQICHYITYSKFINEFSKTIKFLCIIGVFEYFFFVLIINQYHLTTPKILECYVLNKIGL